MALILVVDDDDQVRKMLRISLQLAGYSVVVASDGRRGIKLQRLEPADLIITDILMPNKEGFQTITELRQEFPETKIVAISGGSDTVRTEDFLNIATKLGANCALQKPVERTILLDVLEKLLAS